MSNCLSCGSRLEEDDRFCGECGAPVRAAPERSHDGADGVVSDLAGAAVGAASHPGLRKPENQDAFRVLSAPPEWAAVVCDGVSTSQMPHVAARTAAEEWALGFLQREDPEGRDARAAAGVRELPFDPASPLPPASCALVSCSVLRRPGLPGSLVRWSWVGDCRLYHIPERGNPVLLTRDNEQGGVLSACLGRDADDRVASDQAAMPPGGWMLLCTDGLWRYDPEALAAAVQARSARDPREACKGMVRRALERGGADNVTVALIRLP